MNYKERYDSWLTDPAIDEATKAELRALTDEKEIEDRFYRDLEFGTAGLRGILGAGTNRMNPYIVGRATEGLARYLSTQSGAAERGVVIAHDSRHMSAEFARRTALLSALAHRYAAGLHNCAGRSFCKLGVKKLRFILRAISVVFR